MGGRTALDSLRTVRYEIMTQWISLVPDAQPFRDAPSYERQTEWRDYKSNIWRNVRRSATATGWAEMIDLVIDSVPARRFVPAPASGASATPPPGATLGWAPLNVAYLDERRELFSWAPERVVLELRDANDLVAIADTTISGDAHAVVTATVQGYPFKAFFRKASGVPTMVRYRADEENDFGLAPWGPMDVEIWYSRWVPNVSSGVVLPRQWDTKRVGLPYKRMSVLSATFNVPMPPDSLTFPDTVRQLYRATGLKPMGDRQIDSATVSSDGGTIAFFGFGNAAGAVRLGNQWLLVDGGNIRVNAERAATWIKSNAPGGVSAVGGAILTTPRPGSIAAWAARAGMPVYVAPTAAPTHRLVLRNHGVPASTLQPVTAGRWIRAVGATRDSLWLEPVDLINGPGLIVYAPSRRWAYSGAASATSDIQLVAETLQRRGWTADRVGVPGRMAGVAVPKSTSR